MNKSYNMNIDTGEKTWLTPPHGRTGYSRMPTASCSFADGFISTSPTERQ